MLLGTKDGSVSDPLPLRGCPLFQGDTSCNKTHKTLSPNKGGELRTEGRARQGEAFRNAQQGVTLEHSRKIPTLYFFTAAASAALFSSSRAPASMFLMA